MNMLKNVWADLVERRLWPVAVALVIALVAIPIALGRSGGGSTETTALPASPSTVNAKQLVSLSTLKPKGAPLGPRHNPFRGQSGTAAATAPASPAAGGAPTVTPVAAATGGAGSPAPAPAPAPAGPVGSAPSDSAVTAPAVPATPPASTPIGEAKPRSYAAGYRVDVTYGRSGDLNPHHDLARLDPLSALQAPLVLFLGVKDDRQSAVFMVLGDAATTGDGICRPSPNNCQVFGLKSGDAELLDVPSSDGRALRYELQVDKVAPRTVNSFRSSVHYRHRESKAGRSLLQRAIVATRNSYVAKYRYALAKGVISKVMPRAAK